jgi:predicted amidohydrolase
LSDSLDVILAQTAPRPGATDANVRDLLAAASRASRTDGPSLVVAPELALTGYDLRDAAYDAALEPAHVAQLLEPAGSIIAGFPERASDGALYNSAAHVDGGRVVAAGADVVAYDWNGWRIGLLICEDYWHPGLVYALAAQRIELLVVLAAAPGRGVLDAQGSARFASWETWRRMAEVYARVLGIFVALANRAGVEDGVTFAGGSFVAAPTGALVASAAEGEVATVSARLERAELARVRTPAWHGRDDRPLVVARALLRAEGVG